MNRTIIFLITVLFILVTLKGFAIDVNPEIKALAKNPASIENWGLKKIETEKSWNISKGNKKIVVAIIDTGIDMSHPALKNNIWINPKEIPNNGIDDDHNGFIDDTNGWNFVNHSNKPIDFHGHGTHIAGIIHNVAPEVSFMVLKYFDPKGLSDDNLSNTVKAIDYAIKNGAQIINYSGGGFGKNPLEEAAIKRAKDKNILFVAAAGNDTIDSDKEGYYPASYDLSNIISVASLTSNSELVKSSNFGLQTVDIAAPGKDIYSTLPNGKYGFMTGTSQATAFVTGALAILMDSRPDLKTPEKYIENLVKTGNFEKNLSGKTKYQTKLNSYRALAMKGVEENPTQINSDIFSSDLAVVDADQILKKMGRKNNLRIPAQQ
jgi:thermitase